MIYDGLCVYAFPDFCVCVGGGEWFVMVEFTGI
jgi:hypothetical protein